MKKRTNHPPVIFLNPGKRNRPEAIVFENPVSEILCLDPSEITGCFRKLERMLSKGLYAAGFLSYESGECFGRSNASSHSFPLMHFSFYKKARTMTIKELLKTYSRSGDPFQTTWHALSTDQALYTKNIAKIKRHLEKGDTYQVNYSIKHRFGFTGEPFSLFLELLKNEPSPYSAFIKAGNWSIVSCSPELFFERQKDRMFVRPMKGTIARGSSPKEDIGNQRLLERSEKNRAENIMIVDLLRNDLGKISEPGSVRTSSVFKIERYKTLFQMTSSACSVLKNDLTWEDIFKALFPSGSITGAPKKRTMEIIKDLEKENRNIYTGCMGYITPGNKAVFNVAIRTLLLDNAGGTGELGIGGGIVYDSSSLNEYKECLLKGTFFTGPFIEKDPELLETILWEKGSYFLLSLHMNRLMRSAGIFKFKADKKYIFSSLLSFSKGLVLGKRYRVRLLLDRSGNVRLSSSEITTGTANISKITVSGLRTRKNDFLLRHKTTRRELYDAEHKKAAAGGFFDVIFFNDAGELTEGAITNVVLRLGKKYYTPPVSSGLLPGIYREHLLSSGKFGIKEKVLFLEDLLNADEILLINSVRKIVPAQLG